MAGNLPPHWLPLPRTPIQAVTAAPASPNSSLASQIRIDPLLAGLIGLATLGLILFLSSGVKINRRN